MFSPAGDFRRRFSPIGRLTSQSTGNTDARKAGNLPEIESVMFLFAFLLFEGRGRRTRSIHVRFIARCASPSSRWPNA